jgi:hypothetical protein
MRALSWVLSPVGFAGLCLALVVTDPTEPEPSPDFPGAAGMESVEQLESGGRLLDQKLAAVLRINEVEMRLGTDLAAGRCPLDEAVDSLVAHPDSRNPAWRAARRWKGMSVTDRQCMALLLATRAMVTSPTPDVARRLRSELQRDFAIPQDALRELGYKTE